LYISGSVAQVALSDPITTVFAGREDSQLLEASLDAVANQDWELAQSTILLSEDPLPRTIVEWLFLSKTTENIPADRLVSFLDLNPKWPNEKIIRQKIERSSWTTEDSRKSLLWFDSYPPETHEGKEKYIEILLSEGRTSEATDIVKKLWVRGKFLRSQERQFLTQYDKLLTVTEHSQRLDYLLWHSRTKEARRMLHRVIQAEKTVGIARIYLIENHPDVDLSITDVPTALRNHPGLIYDRVRWRKRANKNASARDLLFSLPNVLPHHSKWWKEIKYQIRESLDEGLISDAYQLAFIGSNLDEAVRVDANWLAGWIALQFLGKPEVALTHFSSMYGQVSMPISVARAAYWAGRAATELKERELSQTFFEHAAAHQTTFYGQLAAERLGTLTSLDTNNSAPKMENLEDFRQTNLLRPAQMLGEIGESKLMKKFILHMVGMMDDPSQAQFLANLPSLYSYPHITIAAAKLLLRKGIFLPNELYPIPLHPVSNLEWNSKLEAPLTLAVARQESEMNPSAISGSGARGFMQIMPRTAKQVARDLGINYDKKRLTNDTNYNILLGATYLHSLLKQYKGSYVIALAAYNAGPKIVRKWLQRYGDPRSNSIDKVDWIERLPYAETRNYVQRVLESLVVYQHRFNSDHK
jgi:soluble lytic murein transglycosylase